jgi:fructoselysine-6-P-deglycase FrlB-like protein
VASIPTVGGATTSREVMSQPEIWSRVIAEAPVTSPVLPAAGEKVLVVGCGTSYYVGDSYARRRNAAGLGRTRAAIPAELEWVDDDEVVLVLSRSGTTADVVVLAERLRGTHRVVGIIGAPGTALVQACHEVAMLDYADEESVVQTRFSTSVLVMLRASLGEDLVGLPAAAQVALDLPVPDPLPDHVVFLGTGPGAGLAEEAALKCQESAGVWAEAHPVREYQHGPISSAGPSTLVWGLDPLDDALRAAVLATGARVLEPALDALAQLPAVHRLALALAAAHGRDPDRPPHLARSVLAG